MDSIVIEGGNQLNGTIKISGSKNASLPIMAGCILFDEQVTLTNIPKLSDIYTMIHLLENHGVRVKKQDFDDSYSLNIMSNNVTNYIAPYEIVRKMRASIWVLGPLLAKYGKAEVSLPGGCSIGARLVDQHIESLKALGAEIYVENGYIIATAKKLKATEFQFGIKSVGATINAILAAVFADGASHFINCAQEPEIVDLCHFLNKAGAKIAGIGSDNIVIDGVSSLNSINYEVLPDRIEAGTYLITSAMTGGSLDILNVRHDDLKNITIKLENAGVKIEYMNNAIRVHNSEKLKPTDISTNPYPGFSTDLQAQFMTLMTTANGRSVVTENIFENRFMHIPELCRMGADIKIEGNRAIVTGVEKLKGAEVMASDLRASVSLITAGLVAAGKTTVHRVYHLDRGYQDLVGKLRAVGAEIHRKP